MLGKLGVDVCVVVVGRRACPVTGRCGSPSEGSRDDKGIDFCPPRQVRWSFRRHSITDHPRDARGTLRSVFSRRERFCGKYSNSGGSGHTFQEFWFRSVTHLECLLP